MDGTTADRKAQADTGTIVAALRERHEEFFGPARWQTAALIGDLDEHVPRGNARGQRNAAPGVRELERVLQQVGEGGRKHFAIGRDRQAGVESTP